MTSGNPFLHRKLMILAIDVLAIIGLIYALWTPARLDDPTGLTAFIFIVALIVYNVYAILLIKFFTKDTPRLLRIEVLYTVLLLLPIVLFFWWFY